MKNIKWVGLVTVLSFPLLSGYGQTPEAAAPGAPGQAQAAAPVNLSPAAAEVVRLAGSGVGDDVVLAYIQNSQAPFSLSADAVLYLKDIGLSPQVTSAMLSHDGTLRNQSQQYAPAAPAAPVQAAPPGNAPVLRERVQQRQQDPSEPYQLGRTGDPGLFPGANPRPDRNNEQLRIPIAIQVHHTEILRSRGCRRDQDESHHGLARCAP